MRAKIIKSAFIILACAVAVVLIAVGIFHGVKYIKNYVGDTVVSFENKTALAGDTVKMPFSIIKNHGLWGAQIIINYDANALQFLSCANGDVFDECEVNDNKGMLSILVNQTELENVKENGLIATLNFKIKEGAAKGDYKISFDDTTNFCDINTEIEGIILEDGIVTVK